jgi:signal transduction histidine kinase
MPLKNSDGSISKLRLIHDITHLKENEKQLQRTNLELQLISQEEHKQRQLSDALVGAALVLNKSTNLEEVLNLILEQIRQVIPYQLAEIALLEGDSFYDAYRRGDPDRPEIRADRKNLQSLQHFPLLAMMRQSRLPVLINDTTREPEWIGTEGVAWSRAFLSAPLIVEDQVIGFVNLFAAQPGFFTHDMSHRLVAFAAHAAVAIQNAWLFQQVRASSERLQSLSRRLVEIQESERLYIARELHDEAGQMLTSLMLDLQILEKRAAEPDAILKKAAEMEISLNEILENLHRIAMALRPASLDHLGLVPAIRQLVESRVGKTGPRIGFRGGKVQKRLPANVETVVYRVVQEALTNAIRHAHATRVDVVLTVRDEKLIVIVEDDGVGFDPQTALNGNRLGLFGMRERAEMVDGQLLIESAPGSGTTIMMEVAYADTDIDRG